MAQSESLKNKVGVVTGGCGLIGKNFIQAVAKVGGTAIIADINPELGRQVAHEFAKNGIENVDFVEMNITDQASINAAITTLHETYGRIDALVNNAYPRNKQYGKKFHDVTYADFCENVGLNLGGYFLTSQKFSTYFKRISS